MSINSTYNGIREREADNDVKWAREQMRNIREIALEIHKDWKSPYFGAVPYLEAMLQLDSITDKYGADSAKSTVLYFLSNAATWRGETVKRVKKELKRMTGVK